MRANRFKDERMGPAIPLYRPSRRLLPSFPRKRESRTVLAYDAAVLASPRGIPAYAGRTVRGAGNGSGNGRRDSRLRGNDGREMGMAVSHRQSPRKIRPISPLLIRGGVL